jgi:nucleoside phosphorylase
MLVSAGFAGALRQGYDVGAVVVASNVVRLDGKHWEGCIPPMPQDRHIGTGRFLTVSGIIADPSEKLELGNRYDATAADMESADVAQWCHERGVPFCGVRAISDDVDTPVPSDLLSVTANGRVAFDKLALRVVRRPKLIPALLQLERATRRAGISLAGALRTLFVNPGTTAHFTSLSSAAD